MAIKWNPEQWGGEFHPGIGGTRGRVIEPGDGRAKLTVDQVRRMRALFDSGTRMADLARAFKVSPAQVRNVVRHKQWRYVDGPLASSEKYGNLESRACGQ